MINYLGMLIKFAKRQTRQRSVREQRGLVGQGAAVGPELLFGERHKVRRMRLQ